ncbi:LamG domain-containing protein [Patescibacteria group bacterium]|nr:LamG domain-containing protein [Patescibacteria group bacterium]
MNNKEKILKILIALGIAAILFSLTLKYFNPLVSEISKQKEDEARLKDISLLDAMLSELKNSSPESLSGEKNKVYISLPSNSANCGGLNLPSLAENWEYRCKSEADYKKIDGAGWIPIDFSKLKNNEFKTLPIDPINSADNPNYYAFLINRDFNEAKWALTASIESKKYLKEKTAGSAGADLSRFEIANGANLWSEANGLAGYWNFDAKEDNIAKDSSGGNNDGIIINNPEWVFGKIGQAYLFNGKNQSIEIAGSEKLNLEKSITIEAWVKPLDSTQRIMGRHDADSSGGWHLWLSSEKEFVFTVSDGLGDISLKSPSAYKLAEWHHIAGQYDDRTKKMALYVNGEKTGEITLLKAVLLSKSNFTIGKFSSGADGYFKGTIDEVRLYNRILSPQEIQKSYSASNL